MSVFSVSVVVITRVHSRESLDAIAGTPATSWKPKGERISPYTPADEVRRYSVWTVKSAAAEGEPFESFMADVRPVLLSIAKAAPIKDAEVKLSVGTYANDGGYSFSLGAPDLELLARSGARLWVDSYNESTPMQRAFDRVRLAWGRLSGSRRRHTRRLEELKRFHAG